jgi:serine/threonine-protein kinase
LAGQFAVSPEGTLAYVTSAPTAYPDRELVAVDRQGRITPLGAPAKGYRNHVDLSPDGTRLAVSIQTAEDVRLFTYDLQRGTLSRIGGSLRGEVVLASWAADDRIAVQLVHDGRIEAAILERDAATAPVVVPASNHFWASSLDPSGRLLGMKGGHVWLFPAGPVAEPARALTDGTTTDLQPTWSPDGRWFAYASDATGRFDIYMRPFPGPSDAVMVSLDGGSSPAWDPGGRELFYIEPGADEDRMMAVPVTPAGSAGRPQVLFSFRRGSLFLGTTVLTPFAVAPGGQRFYAVRQPHLRPSAVAQVQLVLDWFDVLRTKLGPSAMAR